MAETIDLYERDYHAWTQEQAARLRALRPNGLDVENLAEEIDDLGKSTRNTVKSLLRQILHHLLKIELHPHTRSRRQWMSEVNIFRAELEDELSENPSLRAHRHKIYPGAWRLAVKEFLERLAPRYGGVARELGARLPKDAPPRYDLDSQVLATDWFPATED